MKRRNVIGIGLAAAIVAGGVVAGTYLGKTTDRGSPAAATQPTSLPAEIPRTLTSTESPVPAQPGCPDPSQLNRLPLRDKLAQLLMVGVEDEADARSVVVNHHVGGIFVASWTDLSMLASGALTQLATTATPLPLLVSVDEEGGRVSRLSELIGPSPSARALAQSESPEQVYQLALDRGSQMRTLGINVDFAPVVDITAAPAETVIGDRSFGDDPEVVTR